MFDYQLPNGDIVDERRIVQQRFTPTGQEYRQHPRGLYGKTTRVEQVANGTMHHYAEPQSASEGSRHTRG